MKEQKTFETVDDIIAYYGWGGGARKKGENKRVDNELPLEISSSDESRERERNTSNDETGLRLTSDRR